MSAPPPILHATLIARRFPEGWRGALLRGPSGAGKSELALRALDVGFRLVADDRVIVWTSGGRLFGRAPAPLHGLIEARRLDVLRRPALPFAPIAALVDLIAREPERLQTPEAIELQGARLPAFSLAAATADGRDLSEILRIAIAR